MSRNLINTADGLIKRSKMVMVGSVGEDGFPYQKMMYNARVREGVKTFYLTTNTSSLRVRQYRKNPAASLYFADKRFFNGLMLLGTMEVLEDAESKELIWQPGDTLYYPLGVTDPDYCVLRFTAKSGRFYSNFHSEDFEIE
ncbi:pyridoxamine 5'-phosphate oxidase family protein [Acetanaerobacterium elongatum]|uniref:General stress protein 26 n=1 Tax=Acetanaerobacterium elongatum TaxID=258515 RepID=A0A1G9XAG2_9FIRM|nr:pyridoxamine 5'-phosphate oxidase family protein [Acetanaerobacterium elongatum]SDM93789.1 General stress protein 26 [Acetanaerobacterium elongatum]